MDQPAIVDRPPPAPRPIAAGLLWTAVAVVAAAIAWLAGPPGRAHAAPALAATAAQADTAPAPIGLTDYP